MPVVNEIYPALSLIETIQMEEIFNISETLFVFASMKMMSCRK